MEGSRLPKPIERLTPRAIAMLGIGMICAFGVAARAADGSSAPMSVGAPTVLFSPSSSLGSPAAPPEPVRSAAATTAPVKRPAAAGVHTVPVEAKPLIPPAPAKLSPPPEPRPALSLETDLQPLTPAPQTPPAGATAAPAGKSPTS